MFATKCTTRSLFIAVLYLSSIAKFVVGCKDTDGKFQVEGKTGLKTCLFFEATIRCERFDEGKRLCPETCDMCDSCADSTESFFMEKTKKNATCDYFKKKTEKRCENYIEGRRNCPLTCNTCGGVPPTKSPTAAPSAVGCQNSGGKFIVEGKEDMKSCGFFVRDPSRCDRFSEGKVHCRATCGGCDSEVCQDITTSFPVEGKDRNIKCQFFSKSPARCDRFPEGKQFCKDSCGVCGGGGGTAPTMSPTKSPSKSPTVKGAPTKSPTKAPTAPPTKAPTAPPTKAPTTPPTKTPTIAPTKQPTISPTKPTTNAPTITVPTSTPTSFSFSYSYSYSHSYSYSYSMDTTDVES